MSCPAQFLGSAPPTAWAKAHSIAAQHSWACPSASLRVKRPTLPPGTTQALPAPRRRVQRGGVEAPDFSPAKKQAPKAHSSLPQAVAEALPQRHPPFRRRISYAKWRSAHPRY